MKNCALLSSNLSSVINRSHLSPSREASPKGPRKQTTEPILGTALLGKNSYNRLNGKAWLGLLPVGIYREIMPSPYPLNRGKESSHIRITHIALSVKYILDCASMSHPFAVFLFTCSSRKNKAVRWFAYTEAHRLLNVSEKGQIWLNNRSHIPWK